MKWLFRICILGIALWTAGCSPTQTSKKAESEIRSSFTTLKQALKEGDSNGVIRQMSPGIINIFTAAREFGIDPDAADLEKLSQTEVLIGLQARWLLGIDGLKSKSTAELFEWGMQNEIVRVSGLALVNLLNVTVEGNAATAPMAVAGMAVTNQILSFGRYDGEWKLNYDKFLLASEPEFTAMRSKYRKSKPEVAVMMLERGYNQQIPSLRRLLLAPQVRTQVSILEGSSPATIYNTVMSELSEGRQGDAEDLLEALVEVHTNDQRLAFVQAVCLRSRFCISEADYVFRRVLEMNPRTVEGKCARYILNLDDRHHVDDAFKGLRLLADENPDNPLIFWMIGVQCRDNFRHTGKKDYSAEGDRAYKRVLELFDVGPVLVHQTYANILNEELGRNEESLEHRKIAVQLEPRAWSYQGLANTLSSMKRYDEADKAYAKLIELDANDADYWCDWAKNLYYQGKLDECIAKCQESLNVDKGFYEARNWWGCALRNQGKLKEALQQFEEAIRINPVSPFAYNVAARIYTQLGDESKASELIQRRARIQESPKVKETGSE